MPAGRPIKWNNDKTKRLAGRMLKYFGREHSYFINETYLYKNGTERIKKVEIANDLPTIVGFCRENRIARGTLLELIKEKDRDEFTIKLNSGSGYGNASRRLGTYYRDGDKFTLV